MKKLMILNLDFRNIAILVVYVLSYNWISCYKINDDAQNVTKAYFKQHKLINLQLESLLHSIAKEIRNCKELDKNSNCVLRVFELNDSTDKIYIAQTEDISNLNKIEGIYKLNDINFILFKSEKILKYFQIDDSKPLLFLKENPINYFYEFPYWVFYFRNDTLNKIGDLNFECPK